MIEYNIFELLEKDYLDVYEKMYLEDRCEYLFAVWRDLILVNSDKKILNISKEKSAIILEVIKEFNIKRNISNINGNISIGTLDKNVVRILLKIAVKLEKLSIIDFIFKRTKSAAKAMPQYFYPEEIIDAYISLLEIDKAKDVLIYVSNIEHRSYWYRLLKINADKYLNYPEFNKLLREVRYKSIANLLKNGEELNMPLNLNIFNCISQYI